MFLTLQCMQTQWPTEDAIVTAPTQSSHILKVTTLIWKCCLRISAQDLTQSLQRNGCKLWAWVRHCANGDWTSSQADFRQSRFMVTPTVPKTEATQGCLLSPLLFTLHIHDCNPSHGERLHPCWGGAGEQLPFLGINITSEHVRIWTSSLDFLLIFSKEQQKAFWLGAEILGLHVQGSGEEALQPVVKTSTGDNTEVRCLHWTQMILKDVIHLRYSLLNLLPSGKTRTDFSFKLWNFASYH